MKTEYKICFVGLGSIASKHITNLSRLAIEKNLKFIFFALRSNKSTYEYTFDGVEINELIFENIENYFFDVLFVTNPTSLHLDTLVRFASLTEWFFVEKPISNEIFELSELPSNVLNNSYVSAPLRYSNLYRGIKSFINENPIYLVKVTCSSYMPDWQKHREYSKSFRSYKHLGGGVDVDLIHEIDYVIDLYGQPQSVEKVTGHFSDLSGDSNDVALYLLVYEALIIEIHLDYFGRYGKRSIEFFASDDTVMFDFLDNSVHHQLVNKIEYYEKNDYYYDELKYFFDLMEGVFPNNNSIDNALKVLRIAKV